MVYRNVIKPLLDFIVALVTFVLLFPIFLIITLLLLLVNNGQPFFFQKRPGKHEKIFTIVKFKTMNDKKGENGDLLPDEVRLTRVGRFVRATSLDELPQLLNVLNGTMSLVGPRPLLPEYLPLYNEFQRHRHSVKPGITGYAQINGRNAISWDQKFKLDHYYVEHIGFLLDLKILLKTVAKVARSEGISDGKTRTVTYFKGNNEAKE